MRRSVAKRLIGGGLVLLALFAAWHFVAPTQLGGSTSYAVVVGSSMEPKLERGDLAIVREQSGYELGDVVAYRHHELDRILIHRIVAEDGEAFVLKGDANDFVDSGFPTERDMVGSLWMTVPYAGSALQWAQTPWHAAVIAAGAMLILLAGGLGSTKTRRRKAKAPTESTRAEAPSASSGAVVETVLIGLAAVTIGLAAVTVFAHTRPASEEVEAGELYRQSGAFSYEAEVPASPLYDGTTVRTGDTVFHRLVPTLPVSFEYELDSNLASATTGRARMNVLLEDGDGWKRTFQLVPEREFEGGATTLAGELDLRSFQRLIERFEAFTDTNQSVYRLTVVPEVTVTGLVGGMEIRDDFSPALTFELDDSRLQIPEGSALGAGAVDLEPTDAVTRTIVSPTSFSVFGREFAVREARIVTLVAMAAALALTLAVAIAFFGRRRSEHDPALIQARYGALLIPVRASLRKSPETAVAVESMEALVRLAEHYERMILHEVEHDGVHSFVVEDDGVVYRYETREPPSPKPEKVPGAATAPSRERPVPGQ